MKALGKAQVDWTAATSGLFLMSSLAPEAADSAALLEALTRSSVTVANAGSYRRGPVVLTVPELVRVAASQWLAASRCLLGVRSGLRTRQAREVVEALSALSPDASFQVSGISLANVELGLHAVFDAGPDALPPPTKAALFQLGLRGLMACTAVGSEAEGPVAR